MHALLTIALVADLVTGAPQHMRFRQPNLPRSAAAAAPYTFCGTALASGNRVGTWGCINGDGTAPAGDSISPWVAVGAPSSTAGTTCTAPSYQTLNGATPDYFRSTSAVTAVPSAFTLCGLYDLSNSTVFSSFLWGTYPCCASYTITTEQSASLIMYPNGGTSTNTAVALGTSNKTLVCYTYSGGTEHAYVKSASGSPTAYTTQATAAPSTSGTHKIHFGAESTSYRATGKFYGGFYTEKALSQSELDTIFTATVTCP